MSEETVTPNITTTQSIESGNTVVQTVDPVTGEVTQVVHQAEAEAQVAANEAKVIEAEITERATASPDAGGAEQEDNTLQTPVGQLDKGIALTRARVQATSLSQMLHNVAGHADLDVRALAANIESLLAALRHLV